MPETNESRISEGGTKTLLDFKGKVEKHYVNRPGKKKLKTEEGDESEVLVDIIEAIDDKEVLAWPATMGARKIVILLKHKEDEIILETWGDILSGLEEFCKDKKILKPIKVKQIDKNHSFIRVFVENYNVFINLLSRFYLFRKGKNDKVRCAIHVSRENYKIWLWPIVDTRNMIAVCLKAELLIKQWDVMVTDIRRRARENGLDFDEWDWFIPPK